MTKLSRRTLLSLPLALAAGQLAGGRAAAVSQEEPLQRIVTYLNRIDTLQGRFVQTSSNGAAAAGNIALERPGRLRFEYDSPHPFLMIADGTLLLLYDRDLEQATFLPLAQSPLWFLLREEVTLDDDSVEVTEIAEQPGLLSVTVKQRGAEVEESLPVTLLFSEPPLLFRRWRLTDLQGITTEVTLLDVRQGVPLDDELFATGRYSGPRLNNPDR